MTELNIEALDRAIAFFNGKGGVGKTSSVANTAGHFSLRGFKVLTIDLDTQGNLGLNFGYRGRDDDDEGMGLVKAIQDEEPLSEPVREIRPNIDAFVGGRRLERITAIEGAGEIPEGVAEAFAAKLSVIADEYDLILIDCPPGNRILQQMALAAARYVVIPIDSDPASWDGITKVGPLVARARRTNPDITLLGAFLFGHPQSATRLLKNTRLRLDEISDRLPLMETRIRYSKAAAHDCRQRGQLIHELAGDVAQSNTAAFEALKSRRRQAPDGGVAPPGEPVPERLATAAVELSNDYRDLASEITDRIAAIEAAVEQKAGAI